MEVDLDNTYNMMMRMIIAATRSVFQLGHPDFAQMMTMTSKLCTDDDENEDVRS